MIKKIGSCFLINFIILASVSIMPAAAKKNKGAEDTMCSEIMAMCMKRAGNGYAGICEDMYSQAKNTGTWPATQEPDGTKHAPVPCNP